MVPFIVLAIATTTDRTMTPSHGANRQITETQNDPTRPEHPTPPPAVGHLARSHCTNRSHAPSRADQTINRAQNYRMPPLASGGIPFGSRKPNGLPNSPFVGLTGFEPATP